ncbi:MAG: PAS domain-containing protein [Bacteroidales bacterium]|nr:PAS domain-containing protein [Bacteroidales bacterium]
MIALYLATAVTAILCICLIFLYYRKIKAMNIIIRGTDLIKEQDFASRLIPVGQKDADKIILLFNRMMEQLKSEKLRLQEQNHLLDLLVENSPMGVIILDFDGKVTLCNGAAEGFLQVGEGIAGKRIEDVDSPLGREIVPLGMGEEKSVRLGDSRIYRCSRLGFMDRGFVRPFILIENLTQEVMLAERRAYGKAIRIMAHEVQNTVAGVISTLALLKEENHGGESAEPIDSCTERTREMSLFVKKFADIAKIPQPQLRAVDLEEFLCGSRLFLESLCSGKDISLEYSLEGNCGEVMLDTVLFEQVVINIVKNAVESAPTHIKIATYKTSCSLPALDISNNGAPILPDVATKLFTPFFTTKPNGQGLGLTFIREVLTSHNCRFSLQTREDGETHFCVEF